MSWRIVFHMGKLVLPSPVRYNLIRIRIVFPPHNLLMIQQAIITRSLSFKEKMKSVLGIGKRG